MASGDPNFRLAIGACSNAVVSYVNQQKTPLQFYVQFIEDHPQLEGMMALIHNSTIFAIETLPVVGTRCLVPYENTETFVRGRVTNITGQTFDILLVDYGITSNYEVDDIYKLEPVFSCIPDFATRFVLQHNSVLPSCPETFNEFTRLAKNKLLQLTVTPPENNMRTCQLQIGPLNVLDEMHKRLSVKYTVMTMSHNQMVGVRVSEVNCSGKIPWNFVVHCENNLKDLNSLMGEINSYCNTVEEPQDLPSRLGAPLFVRSGTTWYRALLVQVVNETVRAKLVDFGTFANAPKENVRPASYDLVRKMPMQAITCRLQLVDTLENAALDFQEATSNLTNLLMKCVCLMDDNEHLVELHDPDRSPQSSLSKLILRKHLNPNPNLPLRSSVALANVQSSSRLHLAQPNLQHSVSDRPPEANTSPPPPLPAVHQFHGNPSGVVASSSLKTPPSTQRTSKKRVRSVSSSSEEKVWEERVIDRRLLTTKQQSGPLGSQLVAHSPKTKIRRNISPQSATASSNSEAGVFPRHATVNNEDRRSLRCPQSDLACKNSEPRWHNFAPQSGNNTQTVYTPTYEKCHMDEERYQPKQLRSLVQNVEKWKHDSGDANENKRPYRSQSPNQDDWETSQDQSKRPRMESQQRSPKCATRSIPQSNVRNKQRPVVNQYPDSPKSPDATSFARTFEPQQFSKKENWDNRKRQNDQPVYSGDNQPQNNNNNNRSGGNNARNQTTNVVDQWDDPKPKTRKTCLPETDQSHRQQYNKAGPSYANNDQKVNKPCVYPISDETWDDPKPDSDHQQKYNTGPNCTKDIKIKPSVYPSNDDNWDRAEVSVTPFKKQLGKNESQFGANDGEFRKGGNHGNKDNNFETNSFGNQRSNTNIDSYIETVGFRSNKHNSFGAKKQFDNTSDNRGQQRSFNNDNNNFRSRQNSWSATGAGGSFGKSWSVKSSPQYVVKIQPLVVGSVVAAQGVYIVDPSEFYLQPEISFDALVAMGEEISAYCAKEENVITPQDVKTGDFCLAKFKDDNSWYRAKVMSVIGSDVNVDFIDYGNKATVTELQALPEKFSTMPGQAISCCLRGVTPEGNEFCQQETDKLSAAIDGKTVQVELVGLCGLKLVQFSVVLRLGETCVNCELGASPESLLPLDILPIPVLPTSQDSSKHSVSISWFMTPDKFHVNLQAESNHLKIMSEEIGWMECPANLQSVRVPQLVLAPKDGKYFRATVMMVKEPKAKVYFVDVGGPLKVVSVADLHPMPESLKKTSPLAVPCRLADIAPVVGGQAWVPGVKQIDDIFRSCTTFDMTLVENGTDGVFNVELLTVPGGVPVSKLLIDQKLAVKPGETGMVIGGECHVFMTFCEGITMFHVTAASRQSNLDKLQKDLQNLKLDSADPVSSLKQNVLVAARNSEDNVWYRGQPLSDSESLVYFVDFGNVDNCKEVRALPEQFTPQDHFSYPCRLPLAPLNTETKFSDQAQLRFEELSFDESSTLTAKIYAKLSDGVLLVDLLVNSKSICDLLVSENLARPLLTPVFISSVESESLFYVHLTQQEKQLQIIETTLADSSLEPLEVVQVNDICVAKFDEDQVWYRAKVLEQIDEKSKKVVFIDYGNTAVATEFKKITAELEIIPPLAKVCTLNVPVPKDEEEEFIDLILDGTTKFEILLPVIEESPCKITLLKDGKDVIKSNFNNFKYDPKIVAGVKCVVETEEHSAEIKQDLQSVGDSNSLNQEKESFVENQNQEMVEAKFETDIEMQECDKIQNVSTDIQENRVSESLGTPQIDFKSGTSDNETLEDIPESNSTVNEEQVIEISDNDSVDIVDFKTRNVQFAEVTGTCCEAEPNITPEKETSSNSLKIISAVTANNEETIDTDFVSNLKSPSVNLEQSFDESVEFFEGLHREVIENELQISDTSTEIFEISGRDTPHNLTQNSESTQNSEVSTSQNTSKIDEIKPVVNQDSLECVSEMRCIVDKAIDRIDENFVRPQNSNLLPFEDTNVASSDKKDKIYEGLNVLLKEIFVDSPDNETLCSENMSLDSSGNQLELSRELSDDCQLHSNDSQPILDTSEEQPCTSDVEETESLVLKFSESESEEIKSEIIE